MNSLAGYRPGKWPFEILRNCPLPTTQRFLWYFLCFDPLHILGGEGTFCFLIVISKIKMASCVVVSSRRQHSLSGNGKE